MRSRTCQLSSGIDCPAKVNLSGSLNELKKAALALAFDFRKDDEPVFELRHPLVRLTSVPRSGMGNGSHRLALGEEGAGLSNRETFCKQRCQAEHHRDTNYEGPEGLIIVPHARRILS